MDIHHIAIRNEKLMPFTTAKPEVNLFVQTHKSHFPLNKSKLKPRQMVWKKWVGGLIVAKASLLN